MIEIESAFGADCTLPAWATGPRTIVQLGIIKAKDGLWKQTNDIKPGKRDEWWFVACTR